MSLKIRLVYWGILTFGNSGLLWGVNISSFSPPLGSPGEQVTINGSGFSAGPVIVKFNGTTDPTAAATADNLIQAQVPTGATTGRISVQVNGGTPVMSVQNFTVIGPGPYITNFTPFAGSAGITVTIGGVHFISGNATNAYFNGKAGANFFVVSDNRIQIDAPVGVTSGPISVRSPAGNNTTATNFFVPPVITGFSPPNGRTGTNVLITGTNFLGATAVTFGGINATSFSVLSNGAIQVTVPTNAVTGQILVDAPAGSAATAGNFVVQPTLFGFSPGFGLVGSSVTVTGANFTGTTSVKFGAVSASFSGVSFGQLTATVPSGAVSAPITVTTADGVTTSASLFYLPASITSFSPTNSPPGSTVTITGLNFTNASAVRFNGLGAASFTVTNNTTIGAIVPNGVSTGPISVTTPAGTASSAALFYGLPGITSFSPTHGLPGTNVVITGSNFLGVTAVKFNGTNASFTPPTNNTTLVAVVPANAQTGPITVIAPGGTNTSASNFVLDYTSDMGLTLTAAPEPVFVGSNLVYTLNLANNGPFAATNVRLTNTLPASVILKAAVTTQGTLATNSNPVIGSLGTIGSGGLVTVTLTVAPQSAGMITNTASVGSDVNDPNPANNTASVTTTVLSPPLLSIHLLSGSRVRISWPVDLTNYVLQFNNALSANNFWSNDTTTPVISGNENVVTETNSLPARFYRLRK